MSKKSIIVQAPGRINIIGEHTDYNDGFVLPASINKTTVFQLKKNETDSTVRIQASNVDENYTFDLNNFQALVGGWQNYVMGVVDELQKLGANLNGFDGKFEGNVPIGSGMSSSAALECSLAFGLNELFDLGFDKWQLIKACQMAEHHFAGTKCGIMDQFASVMGKKDQVMLLDCRSLDFKYIDFKLHDHQLLLLNTNISHNLASSEYNTRRNECAEGLALLQQKYPEVKSLRDATMEMLHQRAKEIPPKIFRRCRHVILENHRVHQATNALKVNDIQKLGQLMYQSHISLQKDYEVSCPELDFLVNLTWNKDYVAGSRMMGGGFGGCTLNIIEKNQVEAFIKIASEAYQKKFKIDLSAYPVSIEDGVKLIS